MWSVLLHYSNQLDTRKLLCCLSVYAPPWGHLSLPLNSGSSDLLGTNLLSVKDLDVYVCGLCGNPMVQCPSLMSPSAMIEFLKKLKTFPTGKVTVTKQREFRFVPRRLNLREKWAAEVQNPSRSRWCYIQYLTYCSQQLIISNWGPL